MRDDQRVDRLLRQRVPRAPLGDRDTLRLGRGEVEDARVDQSVMDQDIGGLQSLDRAHGQQARITGTCTNQDHAPPRGGIEKTSHILQMIPPRIRHNRAMLGAG